MDVLRTYGLMLLVIYLLVLFPAISTKFCDHLDIVIVNASLKARDGTYLGRVVVNYSEVDKLLAEGLKILGSVDESSSSIIISHIEERMNRLKLLNRKKLDSNITVIGATRSFLSQIPQMESHTPLYFLTSQLLNEEQSYHGYNLKDIHTCSRMTRMFNPSSSSCIPYVPLLPKELLGKNERKSTIRVYQTIGAFTGGTTAMRTLATTLKELDFAVVLCNATNITDPMCNAPRDSDIAITGEWCQPVLDEYLKHSEFAGDVALEVESLSDIFEPRKFHGRGVQYFLGFHHGRDECRGWIAAADSQFIYTTLVHRGLQAYFLGCVMAEKIEAAWSRLVVRQGSNSNTSTGGCKEIVKEKLILLDGDFFDDYPPVNPVKFDVPLGYEFIVLRGFSSEEIIHLLHRAQIILDLAMPGPERISSEAILFGVVPIIAERWNGASQVDFPGVLRVDALNGSAITDVLQYASDHYEHLLKIAAGTSQERETSRETSGEEFSSLSSSPFLTDQVADLPRFWSYIASMWKRSQHTVDAYFSSMHLHFILDTTLSNEAAFEDSATNSKLQRETRTLFQTIALLYLFPLASVEIIVSDVFWFVRHHYVFVDYLRQSGYLRIDPMDPREFNLYNASPSPARTSFVRFRTPYSMSASSAEDRAWDAFRIWIPVGYVFRYPTDLYSLVRRHITSIDTIIALSVVSEYQHLILAGPEHVSGSAFYHSSSVLSQRIALSDTAVSMLSICDLLQQQDEVIKTSELGLVRGATETLFWQMLMTTYQRQLRASINCS